ncbi:MAG: hypothetical protein K2M85_03405 [Paramuribaculum sp.]|nr:hypothetical protein [Paramuribaculum sp.]
MIDFKLNFFYEGKEESISAYAEKEPNDGLEANVIAWGAIRLWFDQRGIDMPNFVRNVQYTGSTKYTWDIMPTKDSKNS